MSTSLKVLHSYLIKELPDLIFQDYSKYKIISEADLQGHLYMYLRSFLERNDKYDKIRILNKPFLKKVGLHPDMIIFKNLKPWIVFEIKEKSRINPGMLKEDFERIQIIKKHYEDSLARGYFFSVSIRGDKISEKLNIKSNGFFYEVPISLENRGWEKDQMEKWKDQWVEWKNYSRPKI